MFVGDTGSRGTNGHLPVRDAAYTRGGQRVRRTAQTSTQAKVDQFKSMAYAKVADADNLQVRRSTQYVVIRVSSTM